MIAKEEVKTWLKLFGSLVCILVGFPLWSTFILMLLGLVTGTFIEAYGVGLWLDKLYYALPASMVGNEWYPIHEFGLAPTPNGIIAGAITYTVIAAIISSLISFEIRAFKRN